MTTLTNRRRSTENCCQTNAGNTNIAYFLGAVVLFLLISCGRIRHESCVMASRAKDKVRNNTTNAIDKVFPTFNAYTPDTKYNKKRFKEFLEIEPTADVKNIYCFDDAIGIDADYEFAFKCEDSTISKIIQKLNLTKTVKYENLGLNFGPSLPWWDTTKISQIIPYWKKGDHETYWYLWYDAPTQIAYFQTFDM
jgi:hypothetical protein